MKKIILILVIAMSSTAFSQAEPLEGPLVHTVLFWLDEPDNASNRADFEKAIKELMAFKSAHRRCNADNETDDKSKTKHKRQHFTPPSGYYCSTMTAS